MPTETLKEFKDNACSHIDFYNLNSWCEAHAYPELQGTEIANAEHNWDIAIDANDVLATIDTGAIHNMTYGLLFLAEGAYYREPFRGLYYFNYADVNDTQVSAKSGATGFGASLTLILNNGDTVEFTDTTYYDKNALAEAIQYLRDAPKPNDPSLRHRQSGYVHQAHMTATQHRQCHTIIHSEMIAAMSGAPADAQVNMIERLADVFGVSMDDPAARHLRDQYARTLGQSADGFARFARSTSLPLHLLSSSVPAMMTELMGWMAVHYFFETARRNGDTAVPGSSD